MRSVTEVSSTPPIPVGDLLTTDEVPGYLEREYRVKRGKRRLAELRASGEGPPYLRDGSRVIYRRRDVDAWALRLLGKPMTSTSEEAALGRLSPKLAQAKLKRDKAEAG
jgi:hypothetical protein